MPSPGDLKPVATVLHVAVGGDLGWAGAGSCMRRFVPRAAIAIWENSGGARFRDAVATEATLQHSGTQDVG